MEIMGQRFLIISNSMAKHANDDTAFPIISNNIEKQKEH